MQNQDSLIKKIVEKVGKVPFTVYDPEGNLSTMSMIVPGCTYIPEEVWELSSLQDLRLGDIRLEYFPTAIEKLTQLRSLRLVNCSIQHFPDEKIALPSLTTLDIELTILENIPPLFFSWSSLQVLKIQRCQLRQLASDIELLQKLEVLNLGHNHLTHYNGPIVDPKVKSKKTSLERYFSSIQMTFYIRKGHVVDD